MEIVPLDDFPETTEVKVLNPSRNTLVLKCNSRDLVSKLKATVLQSYELDASTTSIRLIYNGKLLHDGLMLCAISSDHSLSLHCSINSKPAGRTEESHHVTIDHPHYRGFDRFREVGFTEEEVLQARVQFYQSLPRDQVLRLTDNELFQLEDNFVNQPVQVTQARQAEEVHIQAEGTQAQFLGGTVLGFLLGPFVLFWMWHEGSPDGPMTERMKVGLFCGIGVNLSYAFLRFLEYLL